MASRINVSNVIIINNLTHRGISRIFMTLIWLKKLTKTKSDLSFIITLLLVLSFCNPIASFAMDENGGWKLAFVMKGDTESVPLLNPSSLFIDISSEKYYVIDSGNNRLLSFGTKGNPLHSFDAGGELSKPVSMAKNSKGILLLVEKGKEGITKIDLSNKLITTDLLQYNNQKLYPQKIRFLNDTTYLLDKASGSIFALSADGNINKRYACDACAIGFIDFQIIQKEIWALAQQEGEIVSFFQDGKVRKRVNLQPKPEFPVSFAINKVGDIFVVERHAGRISVFDASGTFRYVIFARGEKEGNLSYPIEVQIDTLGRLCVVEEGNGRVSVFNQ